MDDKGPVKAAAVSDSQEPDKGKKYGVRLFCNEFGAYRLYSLSSYRKAWIQEVRTALGKNGIDRAMWEFDGTFGLARRIKGKDVVDKDLAAALGLRINK